MGVTIVVILIGVICFLVWLLERNKKNLDEYQAYVRFLESNLESIQAYIEPIPLNIYTSQKVREKDYMKNRSNVRYETGRRTYIITNILRNANYWKKMLDNSSADTALLVKELGVLNQKLYDLENPEERRVEILDLSEISKPEAEQVLEENIDNSRKSPLDLDK